MSTLTEMLTPILEAETDPVEADWLVPIVKKKFKDWLRTVGLPDYQSYGKGGVPISATEAIRKLLITLVDEP
ncbi:MAG: hypothetical protein KAY32_15490 [Candidatus Eisenbacteria sp.]|nr:hypothetical protein [Candidatus Eisenbacteria bacterium]